MRNKKKSLLSGSILATAMLAASGFNANATDLFHYSPLGSGEEVRSSLLEKEATTNAFELKCGNHSPDGEKMKKGKDGKCGEGKCGDKKAEKKKKGKDGKCGEGKCGDNKDQKDDMKMKK